MVVVTNSPPLCKTFVNFLWLTEHVYHEFEDKGSKTSVKESYLYILYLRTYIFVYTFLYRSMDHNFFCKAEQYKFYALLWAKIDYLPTV